MSSNKSPGRFVIASGIESSHNYRGSILSQNATVLVESPSTAVVNDENKVAVRLSSRFATPNVSSPITSHVGDYRDEISTDNSCTETPMNNRMDPSSPTREDSSFNENNCSFPLFSPSAESGILQDEGEDVDDFDDDSASSYTREEETEEERIRREQEESEALARQMMAEEAMASYNMSANFLRDHADNYSSEDLAALQAAMAEEDSEEEEFDEGPSAELSYDTLLRLGERLGDVKQERWAMVAKEQISKLPTFKFSTCEEATLKDRDDSEVKCLVCQCPYEEGDLLRRLPCKHCFHAECVDQWLMNKDVCPYCRQAIV